MKRILLTLGLVVLGVWTILSQNDVILEGGGIAPGNTSTEVEGMIRYKEGKFEYFKAGSWSPLVAENGSGSSPWITNNDNIYFNSGNVGIGRDNPEYQLDINGSSRSTGQYMSTDPNGFRIARNGRGVFFRNDGNRFFLLKTLADEPLGSWDTQRPLTVLLSNGFVGVNRVSPGTPLNVGGKIRSSSSPTSNEFTEIGHGGANGYINTQGDGSLQFRHDGVPLMRLNPEGKLLVGNVTAPGSYSIYAENGIMTEEVKVALKDASDWSDDEFGNAPSLEQVKESIETNSHLYGMPSAKEVKEKGINVTEMFSLLLREIEWLNVHMIRLSDENSDLKEEIAELKED